MTFQLLDDKLQCFGIYSNGEFIYDRIPANSDRTWNWHSHLDGHDINYACLYVGGKSLSDACPDHLKGRLDKREQKIKAFINSAANAKIRVDNHCIFELIPEQHLKHYCEIKNEKPLNHQHVVDLYEMAHDI